MVCKETHKTSGFLNHNEYQNWGQVPGNAVAYDLQGNPNPEFESLPGMSIFGKPC